MTANTFNVNQVKWTQIQSFLDGIPIQDQPLVDANNDVWNFMYPLIKNTPCGLSIREFQTNEFFVDNFSDCDDGSKFPENDTKDSGLDIDIPKQYHVQLTTIPAATILLQQYQVWIRKLITKPSGIE